MWRPATASWMCLALCASACGADPAATARPHDEPSAPDPVPSVPATPADADDGAPGVCPWTGTIPLSDASGRVNQPPGGTYWDAVVDVGDLDQDGDAELLVTADLGPTWVLYGPVTGTHRADFVGDRFAWPQVEGSGMSDSSGAGPSGAGDLDGDGWGDLVLPDNTLPDSGTRLVRRWGSPSGFTAADSGIEPAEGSFQAVAVGDFDGAGSADIVVVGTDPVPEGHVAVLLFADAASARTRDDATLDLRLADSAWSYAGAAAVGDLQGDGIADAVVWDIYGGFDLDGRALLLDGSLTGTVVDDGASGSLAGAIDEITGLGDVDGDGLDDVALVDSLREEVYLVPGGTAWSGRAADLARAILRPVDGDDIARGVTPLDDVDGDGLPDVAVGVGGLWSGSVLLFAQPSGDLTRDDAIAEVVGLDLWPRGLAASDSDADGQRELVVLGQSDGQVSAWWLSPPGL